MATKRKAKAPGLLAEIAAMRTERAREEALNDTAEIALDAGGIFARIVAYHEGRITFGGTAGLRCPSCQRIFTHCGCPS